MSKIVKLLGLMAFLAIGCGAAIASDRNQVVVLATTTSTENSGLLAYLLPKFEQYSGIEVRAIAVGSGKALRMGKDGDVDVLMVHAKPAELEFMGAGYGVERVELMVNDFIFVGPRSDPAGLKKLTEINAVMAALSYAETRFISRGDESGTHIKELFLWEQAGVMPNQATYHETGQGMGNTLQVADELQAYTMVDRGTWLAYHDKLDLEIAFAGNPPLLNQYAAILVNPKRYPDLNTEGGRQLIDWLRSEQGQTFIGDYKVNGQVLFQPNAE